MCGGNPNSDAYSFHSDVDSNAFHKYRQLLYYFPGDGLVHLLDPVEKSEVANAETTDVYSGKAEIDAECRIWDEGGVEENEKARLASMNIVRRAWENVVEALLWRDRP